jgi:hypothetical protein
VNLPLFKEFVSLVQDVRTLQRYHRRTQCPIARRKLPPLEEQLDRLAERVAGEPTAAAMTAAVEARPDWMATAADARQEGGGS